MGKKSFHMGLIPKLIIAIIVGILFGSFMPEWFNRVVVTFSSIFSTFLSFVIPLMIRPPLQRTILWLDID